MLADIAGNDVLDDFQVTNMVDYIELFRSFEIKKRTFSAGMKQKITLTVPVALTDAFKKKNDKEIEEHINKVEKYKGKVSWVKDKLRINPDVAEGLFEIACDSIVDHLKSLFTKDQLRGVNIILMVGGFSESPLLQDKIKKAFPKKKIVIPNEAGLAVLKGAVVFGHDPTAIQERRCRYTYGVGSSFPFKKGIDPEEKKITDDDGNEFCTGKFSLHVTIGQAVEQGEAQVTKSYSPVSKDQQVIAFKFYATQAENPNFVTDPGCTQIGDLSIEISGSGMDRSVEVQMIFSGTELYAEAVEKGKTTNKTKALLNFLG